MLISDEYRALNAQCHEENAGWGTTGTKYLARALLLEDLHPGAVMLDYGCGKGHLARDLIAKHRIDCRAYDPAIPRFSRTQPDDYFDVVLCVDVLEHVEPENLDNVLLDIKSKLRPDGIAYFVVGVVPAVKILPDGRNAHLIVENSDWWVSKLYEHFAVVDTIDARRTTAEFLAWP